jgi:hypothetical protein
MYCNSSGGACFFFDIDVKGGESVVISRMLQWYSWMFFKGLPSMPKGEIVGMFSDRGRVCVFVIDGKDHDQQHNDDRMAISDRGRVCVFFIDGKDHDQQHNDDRMERSEAKLHFRYQKLNSISKFQIPGVGGVKSRDSSS